MPTLTVNRRLARVSAILAGAALTTLALASPAFAEDTIDTNLSGVSSNSTAGARVGDAISVTFTNKSNNSVTSIRPVFTIHLDGMPGDGVRIGRVLGSELPAQSAGDGTVQFSDPSTFELLRNGRRTVNYTLVFTETAPAGKATITIDAYSGNNRLGGDSSSTNVRSNAPRASATPSSTPANTATGIQPTFAAGPSYSLAPLDPADANTPSTSVPVSLYVMGGLLVGVGAVILWLIFRRPKPLAEVAGYPVTPYDQARPSSLGYPRHAVPPLHSTAVLPTVEPPTQPGLAPPVDPYSGPLPPPPPLPRRPRP
jgi:hypothetical protein